MNKGESADRQLRVQRFMRAESNLRVIFGPANRSFLVHDMTEETHLLVQRERETQQWETVTVQTAGAPSCAPEPEDQSLR